MWVQFKDEEIARIIAAVGPGPIADKFAAVLHPDTDAFIDAADGYSDVIHIPVETSIERTRNGAYVLVDWWVANSRAGFLELTDYDDFDITGETRAKREALAEFNVDDLKNGEGCGEFDEFFWETEYNAGTLEFFVGTRRNSGKPGAIWSSKVQLAGCSEEVSAETAFQFVLQCVEDFRLFRQTTIARQVSSRMIYFTADV